MLHSFVAFWLACLTSWLLLFVLIPQLRFRLLDHPNARSSHLQPTPRGGGLVFVLLTAVACGLSFLLSGGSPLVSIPLIALPLALVGFLDDHCHLPASWRFWVQISTAIFVILVSPLVVAPVALLPMLVLLVFAVTAVINFTNFMDGLDGLVAGSMVVAIAAVAIDLAAPWPVWALVGSLFGFLLWNWSPAKVFMGDVGSTFLGTVFAALVLQAPTWPEALALLLVAAPLLSDAFVCVFRRSFAGQPIFQAHRMHLFQRLHQVGWSHARVSGLYIGATAATSLALLWGGLPWVIALACLELVIGIWLDQVVAVPFSLASRS